MTIRNLRRLVEVTLFFEKTYQVSQASSRSEAVEALEGDEVDLVILDLNLGEPKMASWSAPKHANSRSRRR